MAIDARDDGRVESFAFKHPEACGLFNPEHTIPSEIAEVVEALDSMEGFEAAAGGCNTCTAYEIDQGVYYTAQSCRGSDTIYFGYTDKAAANALIGVCERLGVEWDWTGNWDKKVAVGADDVYFE
jgi:hypothetical protein